MTFWKESEQADEWNIIAIDFEKSENQQ